MELTANRIKLSCGDCLDILDTLPDNSVDSIVTDPPYGWNFMGKKWDYDVPQVDVWEKCLRILKPGGHMLVACGTRTQHRMVANIEDAGFEIRDVITHLFGTGFPKSLNISKAIDKEAGVERFILGINPSSRPNSKVKGNRGFDSALGEWDSAGVQFVTAPATDDAKKWQGWGSALKPACEFWTLCRKNLAEKTLAKNVVKWGTGGLNIDESRIDIVGDRRSPCGSDGTVHHTTGNCYSQATSGETFDLSCGRYPANLILDEEAAKLLDEQTGINTSPNKPVKQGGHHRHDVGLEKDPDDTRDPRFGVGYGDTGGASRFFYCAKSSKTDRGEGNSHPTVKPIRLMSYLIKLITPLDGVVLDPFMGSGSTGVAAIREGFNFIGIEKEENFFEISQKRIFEVEIK